MSRLTTSQLGASGSSLLVQNKSHYREIGGKHILFFYDSFVLFPDTSLSHKFQLYLN